jgi:hypothetical protein
MRGARDVRCDFYTRGMVYFLCTSSGIVPYSGPAENLGMLVAAFLAPLRSNISEGVCSSQSHCPPRFLPPDDMHPVPTRILFLLLSFSSLVAAVNFTQCLEDLKNDPNATGGVDFHGHPTSPADAVGLTYKACAARCGTGPEAFKWWKFAQLFSSWILPWLALISQLPFGSGNYVDDFVSG